MIGTRTVVLFFYIRIKCNDNKHELSVDGYDSTKYTEVIDREHYNDTFSIFVKEEHGDIYVYLSSLKS